MTKVYGIDRQGNSIHKSTTLADLRQTYPSHFPRYYRLDAVLSIEKAARTADIRIDGHLNQQSWHSKLHQQNHNQPLTIGIDEAGRGPLLGGVMVTAVLLPAHCTGLFADLANTHAYLASPLQGINDSKKLSHTRREHYADLIKQHAMAWVCVDVPAGVIDDINILQASLLGMQLAGDELLSLLAAAGGQHEQLSVNLLYDGNKVPPVIATALASQPQTQTQTLAQAQAQTQPQDLFTHPWLAHIQALGFSPAKISTQAVVKGDGKHSSIAAASILAKVARDEQMRALANTYPEYGIDKHKGYPTAAHLAAIEAFGVLPEHRRSFNPIKQRL